MYDSLVALKKTLYSDFHFFCSETATFGAHGGYEQRNDFFDARLNRFETSDSRLMLSIVLIKMVQH